MSAQEGLLLKVTHLGTIPQGLHLHDIWDGPQDPYYRSAGPIYLDPGYFVVLDYTTPVALSFESGVIRGLIGRGYVSAEFLIGPTLAAALTGVVPPGDLPQTFFAAANNQVAQADITGFVFDGGVTRSFQGLASVSILAAAPLYAVYTLIGIQKNGTWDLSTTRVGDLTGFNFFITAAGQIQYTSANTAAWIQTDVMFRAITTGV